MTDFWSCSSKARFSKAVFALWQVTVHTVTEVSMQIVGALVNIERSKHVGGKCCSYAQNAQ